MLCVHKFGGTSVGSAERYAAVAGIVEGLEGTPVVVVSAMSGTTDALIAGARAASEGDEARHREVRAALVNKHLTAVDALLGGSPERDAVAAYIDERLADYARFCRDATMLASPHRGIATLGEFTMRASDAVASIGEEISCRILAALLRRRGCPTEAISATRLVRTDNTFGAAHPDMAATHEAANRVLRPLLSEGVIPVVTGYIGATASGATTTLGRGGSDYSAAILGAALDADEVCIWTDVDGILTADPKLEAGARVLRELSYREAEELAYFGADVLHPKTVAPLAARGIPLRILNSMAPDHPGTLIVPQPDAGRVVLPAIISTGGLSLLGICGNGGFWSLQAASRALRCLAEAGAEVLMFSQSFTERHLSLVVRRGDQAHCLRALRAEFAHDLKLGTIDCTAAENVATLSVVGMPDSNGAPIAPRAFAALGALGLHVISVGQAASAYSVSFVIAEADLARAVPFIHRELGL
jgi:bifunctional aspartokinase / homoserine dehydrogenase 1